MSQRATNRPGSQSFKAPFHVKSAGVSLFSILFVGIYYFANVWKLLPSDENVPDGALGLMLIAVVLIIVIEVVLQIVLFIGAGQIEDRTRRDNEITTQALRNAYIVLTVGVFTTIGSMLAEFTSFEMGSILLLAFLLAEVVKYASQIVLFLRNTSDEVQEVERNG